MIMDGNLAMNHFVNMTEEDMRDAAQHYYEEQSRRNAVIINIHLERQQQAIIDRIVSHKSEILTIVCLSKIIKESYSVDHLKEN